MGSTLQVNGFPAVPVCLEGLRRGVGDSGTVPSVKCALAASRAPALACKVGGFR